MPENNKTQSSSHNADASQQQQQQRVRTPPFANWPTFKILTPPQGQFSPKVDEWVFTWCSQTISGRIHGREPQCRSISIRKVFPHEVRNVVSFKRHKDVDAEGKARYPLPAEGQPSNLPRLLGGVANSNNDDSDLEDERLGLGPSPVRSQEKPETKFWEEGWYLWTSTSRQAAQQKVNGMRMNLERQQTLATRQEKMRDLWQDYQDDLGRGLDKDVLAQKYGGKVFGSISPPALALPEQSLLVHLPPDLPPLWGRIERLLAPSYRALELFRESITSGQQRDFAVRAWKKAQTDEPFELARRTLSRTYERWRTRDTTDEDDPPKKGSA